MVTREKKKYFITALSCIALIKYAVEYFPTYLFPISWLSLFMTFDYWSTGGIFSYQYLLIILYDKEINFLYIDGKCLVFLLAWLFGSCFIYF